MPFKDRQIDGGFNRFDMLDNSALEEGVQDGVNSNSVTVSMEVVLALELQQYKIFNNKKWLK